MVDINASLFVQIVHCCDGRVKIRGKKSALRLHKDPLSVLRFSRMHEFEMTLLPIEK